MSLRTFLYYLPRHRRLISTYTSSRLSTTTTTGYQNKLPRTFREFRSTSHVQARHLRFNPPSGEDLFNFRKWDLSTKIVVLSVAGCTVYYIYHLEKVPETGRWRFMDVSSEQEHRNAIQAHKELLEQLDGKLLPTNHPLTRHVRRVVSRILESSDLGKLKDDPSHVGEGAVGFGTPGDTWSDGNDAGTHLAGPHGAPLEREWDLFIVDDPTVPNAMVVGSTVVLFTGILPICQDENGIAAVLGHEIAHAVARHGSEKISSVKVFVFVAWILETALDLLLGFDLGIGRIAATYALQLPNSRIQELEADKIGLTLTAKACYDPRIVPEMQKRLASIEKALGAKRLEFLQTHPASERRAQLLESFLHDAYAIQAASPLCAGMQDHLNAFKDAFGSTTQPGDNTEAWEI